MVFLKKESNYCGDGKKHIRNKGTLKSVFGRRCGSICLLVEYFINKFFYETPYKSVHYMRSNASHLWVYGCVAYDLVAYQNLDEK